MADTNANRGAGDAAARQESLHFGRNVLAVNNHIPAAGQALRAEELFIGGRRAGVTVEPDATYPSAWRVRRSNDLSDITNISRAKDAAIVWARPKGLGGSEVVHWRHRQSRAEASPMHRNERAAHD